MGGAVGQAVQVLVVIDRLGSTLGGLHPLLSRRRLRRLAEAIFLDVIEAIRESRLVEAVWLATRDPEAADIGRRAGVNVTDSVVPGTGHVSGNHADELWALVRGDLPLLEGQDLAFLFGRLGPPRRLILVPTPDSEGLSMVIGRKADAFIAGFEEGGEKSWMQEAASRNIETEVFAMPAGMRPSRPRDLLQIYTAARPSRAKGLLKDWHMGQKLRELEG